MPVASYSNATKLNYVNQPLLKHERLSHHYPGLSIEDPWGLHQYVIVRSQNFSRAKLNFLTRNTVGPVVDEIVERKRISKLQKDLH